MKPNKLCNLIDIKLIKHLEVEPFLNVNYNMKLTFVPSQKQEMRSGNDLTVAA